MNPRCFRETRPGGDLATLFAAGEPGWVAFLRGVPNFYAGRKVSSLPLETKKPALGLLTFGGN